MIKGLVYAIVTTDDVPRARSFYTDKLGLSTEDDMGETFSQFTTREGSMWAVMSRPDHAAPLGAECRRHTGHAVGGICSTSLMLSSAKRRMRRRPSSSDA